MHTDALTIVLLVFIGAGIATFAELHWGRRRRAPRRNSGVSPDFSAEPTGTGDLLIVPSRTHNVWLPALSSDARPAMSVSGHWHVRNRSSRDIYLTRAFIAEPLTEGTAPAVRWQRSGEFGNRPIRPGSICEVLATFWVQPPVCGPDEEFRTRVVLVDQFENQHAIDGVKFRYWSG